MYRNVPNRLSYILFSDTKSCHRAQLDLELIWSQEALSTPVSVFPVTGSQVCPHLLLNGASLTVPVYVGRLEKARAPRVSAEELRDMLEKVRSGLFTHHCFEHQTFTYVVLNYIIVTSIPLIFKKSPIYPNLR